MSTSSAAELLPQEAGMTATGLRARGFQLLNGTLLRSGVGAAFLLSGLFRVSAFIRETYVAGRFGLSPATDAYYGLQQLPLSVATFMFGAFALAFAPAYGQATRKPEGARWLPGLLLHGTVAGLALTAATVGLSSLLLGKYIGHADRNSVMTLRILSLCYVPVIYLGIWASILNATGRPLRSMTMTALPYLTMTASLIVIGETSGGDLMTLPASMALGFGSVGAVAAYSIFRGASVDGGVRSVLWPQRFAEFRQFCKQMLASAAENAGFAANQLLMIYFFGLMGTGAVTANNYAMRIGLLANGMIAQPLAQLAQSRFCTAQPDRLRRILSRYMVGTMGLVGVAGALIFVLRKNIVAILYLHGRFTNEDARSVVALIPAWLVYLLVLSASSIVSRYLFVIGKGKRYAVYMLSGYTFTNVARALLYGWHPAASAVIWCAVAGEGVALLLSLRLCYRWPPDYAGESVSSAIS